MNPVALKVHLIHQEAPEADQVDQQNRHPIHRAALEAADPAELQNLRPAIPVKDFVNAQEISSQHFTFLYLFFKPSFYGAK